MTDQPDIGARSAQTVATSIDHPRLASVDAKSIRVFLRQYDPYCVNLTARTRQLTGENTISIEPATPVNIKDCVETELLVSGIDLGFF